MSIPWPPLLVFILSLVALAALLFVAGVMLGLMRTRRERVRFVAWMLAGAASALLAWWAG